jgi:hypothetical protein
MKRQILGLSSSSSVGEIADGVYLVKVQRAHYRWHKHTPFYELGFCILEPKAFVGGAIIARLQCSPKALWKLAWFLRDFRYSQELLERDEVDPRVVVGLQGVVQFSREIVSGRSTVNLESFAPAADWEHLAPPSAGPEAA